MGRPDPARGDRARGLCAGRRHPGARLRRSLLHGARDARQDPGRGADALALLVLVVASLAFWSAITLWLVLGAR